MQIEWLTLNDESTIVLFYRRCSSAWQRSLSWWKNKARHLSVNGKLCQILWWVTNHLGPCGKVFCYPKWCGFGHFNTVILYFSFFTVSCPHGMKYDNALKDCVVCPVGYFSQQESSPNCTKCPPQTSTKTNGSKACTGEQIHVQMFLKNLMKMHEGFSKKENISK